MSMFSFTEMLARQDIEDTPIEAVTFSHPKFVNDVGNPNNRTNHWRFTNREFEDSIVWLPNVNGGKSAHIVAPFEIGIPERNGELSSDLSITFSVIDTRMIDELEAAVEAAQDPIDFQYRICINFNTVAFFLSLSISEVAVAGGALTATASRADLLNRVFPDRRYLPQHFPGLDR